MHVQITRLEPNNAARFAALRSESLRDSPSAYSMDNEVWDAAPIAQVERMLAPPDQSNGFYLGAWSEEKLIGSLGLVVSKRWKAAHVGTLVAFYVQPTCRRSGVGGALIDALIERARAMNTIEILRGMLPVELGGALQLLESRGFEGYGIEPMGRRTHSGFHDLQYVALVL